MNNIFIILSLIFGTFLAACGPPDTYSMFKHEQSMKFFETGVISTEAMNEYSFKGVIAAVAVGSREERKTGYCGVWATFYSDSIEKDVFLDTVSIFNGLESLVFEPKVSLRFDDTKHGYNSSGFKVADDIDCDFLRAGQKDNLSISLGFEVDKELVTKSFEIEENIYLVPIH